MLPRLHFDYHALKDLEQMVEKLPLDLQRVAFGRAAARTKQVIERQYARLASRHIKLPQRLIMPHLTSRLSGGEVTLKVKSAHIPIEKLGVHATRYGVYVRGRGRYEGNFFIPPASAARAAGFVLLREKLAKRTPTHRIFGPSPADAVLNNRSIYEDLLSDIAKSEFETVIRQQITYLLSRKFG